MVKLLSDTLAQTAEVEHVDKMGQFNINSTFDPELVRWSRLLSELRSVGVWGVQRIASVLAAANAASGYVVCAGFKPARFHLGHLTLARELAWHVRHSGRVVAVVAGFEGGARTQASDAAKLVGEFWRVVRGVAQCAVPEPELIVSDVDDLRIRQLEDDVSRVVNLGKITQLYGWGTEVSVATVRRATVTAAAFLFAATVVDSSLPSLVLVDENQATHAELTKIAGRSLRLPVPAFSYRRLLTSLHGPSRRMSWRDERGAVFLDEPTDSALAKLGQALTGGRPTVDEQRAKGGEPLKCCFYHAADVLLDPSVSAQVLADCLSGTRLCGDCKAEVMAQLRLRLEALRSPVTCTY